MGPMKPYIIWFLAASLTSPPTPPPSHVVLQPPWPPWTWRGLLWSWNFHSNCSSACNWAHTSSRLAPSSHSDLYFLRNVLECEIHVSAMRMLLDVRPQGAQWSQLAHFGIHCCLLQSQASPARAPPQPVTEFGRHVKADPFLGGTRLSWQPPLGHRLTKGFAKS